MKKTIKRIKPEYFDEFTVAKLSGNKEKYDEIMKQDIYEETETDIPASAEIPYINTLLENGLEEYEEGIYAGVASGSLYEFDFPEQNVTISVNLINTYVFFHENKSVWFSTDKMKNNYLYANYETGEIKKFIGQDSKKDKLTAIFDYKGAQRDILRFANVLSFDELFR